MFKFHSGLALPSLGFEKEQMKGETYVAIVRPGIHAAVWPWQKHALRYACNVYRHTDERNFGTRPSDRLLRFCEPEVFNDPIAVLAHIHHVVQQYDNKQTMLTHGGTTREDA